MLFLDGIAIVRLGGPWPVAVPGYRGVDYGTWWPLGDYWGKNERARILTDMIEEAHFSHPDQLLWPSVSADAAFLSEYLRMSDELQLGPLYGLVCSSPVAPLTEPPEWLLELASSRERLGIDVAYSSGRYSFIGAAYDAKNGKLFEFLCQKLNANGLLDSEDDARQFIELHQEANQLGAGLEDLDGATLLELREDPGLVGLRAVLMKSRA